MEYLAVPARTEALAQVQAFLEGQLEEQKIQQATNVTQTISQLVGADTVERYYRSGQKDEAYCAMEERIQAVQTANQAELVCMVYPTQDGQVFIFSSGLGSDMFPLGTLMP